MTLSASTYAGSPAAAWRRSSAIAAILILVLAPSIQLASHIIEPTFSETIDELRWVAEHEGAATTSKGLDLLALPFGFGLTLVLFALSKQRAPRLAHVGGILLAIGLVGLSAVEGFLTLAFIQVGDGRFPLAALADVLENDMGSGPGIVMMLMFLFSAFLGVLTLASALWVSRAVPRPTALLIVASFISDGILVEGMGAPHWIPHALLLVAAAWIAGTILRAARAR